MAGNRSALCAIDTILVLGLHSAQAATFTYRESRMGGLEWKFRTGASNEIFEWASSNENIEQAVSGDS